MTTWKQWLGLEKKAPVEVHGHRGSRGTHPENTLPSFQEAAVAGADFYELDVHLSSDGVPMVFHDPAVTPRLCRDPEGKLPKMPVPLASLTAAVLQRYDCGSSEHTEFPEQKRMPGISMPTLEEVLRWNVVDAPQLRANIEIKIEEGSPYPPPDREAFAKKVLKLVRDFNLVDRVIVQSFDLPMVAVFKRLAPTLRLSCLFENESDFGEVVQAMGVGQVGPFHKLLTTDNIRDAHKRGLRVVPWTVNDPSDWERYIGWGVDGLITDYPRKLRQKLRGL